MADLKVTLTMVTKGLRAGLSKAQGYLKRFRKGVRNMARGFRSAFRIMRRALIAMGIAAAALAVTLKKSFMFERLTTQFNVLFRDLDKAKERIEELKQFSAVTPFQIEEIANASRALEVLTGGIMGSVSSLRKVGDAAAGTGTEFQILSTWVGRAYSAIAAGRPVGRALMMLQRFGILSGEARNEIENLAESGASNARQWEIIEKALSRFAGGMEELAEKGEGKWSTLMDNWTLVLAMFGDELADVAKTDMNTLIEKMKELRADGSLTEWGRETVEAVKFVKSAFEALGVPLKGAIGISKKLGALAANLQQFGLMGGAAAGPASEKIDALTAAALAAGSAQTEEEAAKKARDAKFRAASKEQLEAQRMEEDLARQQKIRDDERMQESVARIQKLADKAREERNKEFQERIKQETDLQNKIWDLRKRKLNEERQAQASKIGEEIAALEKQLEAAKGVAEKKVSEIIAGDRAAATEKKAARKEQRRFDELERRRRRGVGLSKQDQEFMDAFKKRGKEGKRAEEIQKQLAKKREELDRVQDKIKTAVEKTATEIALLRKKLTTLLLLGGN